MLRTISMEYTVSTEKDIDSSATAHWKPCAKMGSQRAQRGTQLIISFNFFIGKARTVLDAGLALNTQGSLVKGFPPLRAGRAGFVFSFRFKAPPTLNAPFFFTCVAAMLTH